MNAIPAWLRLLLLSAAVLAVLFLKGAAAELAPVRENNPPGVFDASRALARLARILGDERPHPVDSEANDRVRQRLVAEIEALGLAPEVRDEFVCSGHDVWVSCARVRNLVFRAGPEDIGPANKAVMIAAHYDSTPSGPGAADDGIGVAALLEIAALLAAEPPVRPVVFLVTDGEEAGLLGARAFVDSDPLADGIERVVNLEARGVRGPAQMFETASPNGDDVRAFAAGAARPFANSMMADIYRLLPNSTDVAEFLPRGYGAINLALIEGVEFYHTGKDSLAHLDPRSVQHMGDLALGALKAALALEPRGGQLAYTDILSRGFVAVPQWAAIALAAFGGAFALFVFLRAGDARRWRALLTPPTTLLLALLLAAAASFLLGRCRAESLYWYAVPAAFQTVAYLCAATAAVFVLGTLGRGCGRARLIAAAWLWIAIVALAGCLLAPGAAILFALPLAVFVLAGLHGLRSRTLHPVPALLAALAAVAVFAPTLHLAELALGFGVLAIPALVAALLFVVAAPLALGDADAMREPRPGALAAAPLLLLLALAVGFALKVPAHSPDKPRPLGLKYLVDANAHTAQWLAGAEPPPAAMQAVAPFASEEVFGLGRQYVSPAPYAGDTPPAIAVLESSDAGDGRRVRFRIEAGAADQIRFRIPAEAGALRLISQGREIAFAKSGTNWLHCFGRGCANREFEIVLKHGAPTRWLIQAVRYRLPESAGALLRARPDWAIPAGEGDATLVSVKMDI